MSVTSDAPESEVMRVLDVADKYSPYRDVFARANDLKREVRVTSRAR